MSAANDYRNSHCQPGKGESYHAAFANNPYRRMVWEMEQAVLDRILKEFVGESRPTHLDFACGTGRILGFLGGRMAQSTGVDVSSDMLAVARRENPGAEILEADLTREDVLGERTFDVITAFRFFPNAQPELRREVMRVLVGHLAPGGVLVFNNHRNAGSLRIRLTRWLGRRKGRGWSRAEAEALVAEAGLTVAAVHPLCVFPASERHPLLPVGLVRGIEQAARRCPWLGRWGENQIVVCRRAEKEA